MKLLPICQYLSDEIKDELKEEVDRSNTKTKLMYLFLKVDYFKECLEYNKLKEDFFNRILILKLLFDQYMFWKDLSFLLTILFNFLILISFYRIDPSSKEYNYSILFNENSESYTKFLFQVLSITQLIILILILINYIVKIIPKYTWKDNSKIKKHSSSEINSKAKNFFIIMLRILTDLDLFYNTAFLVFAILGIRLNYFYFSVHLLEIIKRSSTLNNVIQAIWAPKKQILVTFFLFFLVEYFFTVIIYLFFYDDAHTKMCYRMDTCLAAIFDNTFKNYNGIINYLSEVNYKQGHYFGGRFWIDNLFMIIIIMLVLQMLSGIIIDNFSALREKQQRIIDDMNNICFICGLHRNDLNKLYGNEEGYLEHVKLDHYYWNYLFLIINLTKKKYLSGLDYFIFNNYINDSYSWIPNENCKLNVDLQEKNLNSNSSIKEN